MAVSSRFLFAIGVAFVGGVVSTSAYMSGGGAPKEVTGASHEAAPSLSERLQAEAHGRSLPWSDPVKTAAVPAASPKLQFTPGPAEPPAEGAKSASGGERSPVPQITSAPAPVRPPDEGRERPRVRLADRARQARPALGDVPGVEGTRSGSFEAPQRARAEASGHPRPRIADVARPTPKLHPAPSRNLPSLNAVDEVRLAARRPEPGRTRAPVAGPYRAVRLADRDAVDADASPPRRAREADVIAPDWPSRDEPRARARRSVAASDGLMRWLSGPGGGY